VDLYLIRHADALPVGEHGITDDADRPMSEQGTSQTRLLAAALNRQGIRLELVLTSPLLRARQTAEGMALHWSGQQPVVRACERLAPGLKAGKLARYLRELSAGAVALVGHQPDLGTLAAWLVGSKKAQIDIAKAGVACISSENEIRKGAGTLTWLVTPQWLEDARAKKATEK